MPLGGVLVNNRVGNAIIDKGGEFAHGFTYSGHPAACAVALKNIEIIKENLLSSSVNDIDLLIRTGGEQRISNFMLLQLSYSEFFFSDINWPDFSFSHFEQALKSFSKRRST